MVAIVYAVILSVSNQVIQTTIKDSLVEAVDHNIDEIEYYDTIDEANVAAEIDYYMRYEDGYLEIDDDFLDEVNEVYTSLCLADSTLVYGENPIARETAAIEFLDSEMREVTVEGTTYYVFDRQLTVEGLEGLWLRGVVSEARGDTQLSAISRMSLIALPSLVVLAVVGGYLIARRMLRPIQQLSDTAERIRQGDDLKQRIEIGEGRDELHLLADQFNAMFERLDQSFQVQQQFVSDASHELRTPLSVITAQCELALEQDALAPENMEALAVIQRQGCKMTRLVDDLLDFTRLELHAERYPLEDLDFSQLVEGVCLDLCILKENGITLAWDIQENVRVKGNRELLARLIGNLIGNAYRYGKPEGHTQVTLRTQIDLQGRQEGNGANGSGLDGSLKSNSETSAAADPAAVLSVADDGIGISEEDRHRIFDRFYQADASRTGQGSGLGLAMVAEIAQFHGGTVSVESEPGAGSTFTVLM